MKRPARRPASDQLRKANLAFAKTHPGESERRQPVHTVYGGAQLFKADTAPKIGAVALRTMEQHASGVASFAAAIGWSPENPLVARIQQRVEAKLKAEPVEDFRIDFEDGYGNRPDAEEDGHALQAAGEVADGMERGTLPPYIGIRIKPLNEELRTRSIRTLENFLIELTRRTGRELPQNFVVTLPKITVVEQVRYFAGELA